VRPVNWRILPVCFFVAFSAFSQTPAAPPPEGEASRSTLEVKPGKPAIKTSELDRNTVAPWKRFPRYLLADQHHIWTSPFHTSKSDAKWWAIFGGATTALVLNDEWLSRQLPNTKDQVSVADWTSRIGSAYTLFPILAGTYFLGVKTHSDHLRETGFLGAEALADAVVVSTVMKAITNRERPLEGTGEGRFFHGSGLLNAGFPSGHAIHTWALASVLAHEYRHKPLVPILAYGLALTVSGSRFAARKHFAGDIVSGAAMGWFIGDMVYGKRHNKAVETSTVRKVLSHVQLGVSLR
jgi:membrane-associated phospholipid phosphatase